MRRVFSIDYGENTDINKNMGEVTDDKFCPGEKVSVASFGICPWSDFGYVLIIQDISNCYVKEVADGGKSNIG